MPAAGQGGGYIDFGLVTGLDGVIFLSVDHISAESEPEDATAPIKPQSCPVTPAKPHPEWMESWGRATWVMFGALVVWSLSFGGFVVMLCLGFQDLEFRKWRSCEREAIYKSKREVYSPAVSTFGSQTLVPLHVDEAKGNRVLSEEEIRQQPAWQSLNHRLDSRDRYVDKLEEQIRAFDERLDQQHFSRSRWQMTIQWFNIGILIVFGFYARRMKTPKIH